MDLRELAPVRSVFGKRQLSNPLNTTEFGFATAEEAEPAEVILANISHALFILTIYERPIRLKQCLINAPTNRTWIR